MQKKFKLTLLPEVYAVCQLDAGTPLPEWAQGVAAPFLSITRTADELSIICPDTLLPDVAVGKIERDWKCLRVAGPLEFSMTGVISALTTVLASVGISVLTIATFDTDYLLVRRASLERAIRALRLDGHEVEANA